MIHLDFNLRLPSWNEVISKDRTNRFLGAKMKKETQESIYWLLMSQKAPKLISVGKLVFTFTSPNTKRDLDGFCIKPVLDAFVQYGLIEDDSVKYIDNIEFKWVKGPDSFSVDIY